MHQQVLLLMIMVLLRGLWGSADPLPAGSGSVDFCSTEEFRQDFRAFRDLLEQDYPSLYRYNDSQTIRKLFDSAVAAINDWTSTLEFYSMLKACVSAIRDGHLYVGPSPAIRQYFSDTALLFPINLR